MSNYIEILDFVIKIYKDELGTDLTNKNFHSDAVAYVIK